MWMWWSKVRALLDRRRSLADDLHEEMAAHIQLETEDNVASGMTPEAARVAAQRHFGNVILARERAQQAWSFAGMEAFLQEMRYAARSLRHAAGFSSVVVLTLALGIGANTAIFSVIDAVLLKPLPYPHAERLVRLAESAHRAEGFSVTWINYQHWRAENHSFEQLAAYEWRHMTLSGREEPSLARVGVVTSGFFPLLGMQPLSGRPLSEADDRPGATDVAVVSKKFWAEKLGSDPHAVGGSLNLDGKAYQVVGVVSSSLEFFPKPIDVYVPSQPFHGREIKRSEHGSIRVLGRLKPGFSLTDAEADLDAIMQRLAKADPGPEDEHRAEAILLSDWRTQGIRPALLILMGGVGLVLAIACANVASLVLERSSARAREFAIRAAIGAGRLRLLRQLMTESMMLSLLGGLAGLLLAQWSLRMLINLGPRDIPRLAETALNSQVLLFAGLVSVLTGLTVGLAPIWGVRKLDLVTALKDGASAATPGRGQTLRNLLVAAEIGVTVVLAFTSGLLLRSLIVAENSPPGFAPDHLLALEMILPASSYKTPAAIQEFYDGLTTDLRRLPGVISVGAANCPPASGGCGDWFYSIPDRPTPAQGEVPISFINKADLDYFQAMQIPLLQGRAFTDSDRASSPRVAIVDEAFARMWWPQEQAVGHRIKFGGPYLEGPTLEIVGVAGNVSQVGLDAQPQPEIFLPSAQTADSAMVIMIRTAGDPEALSAAVRGRVAAADRNLPIQSLQAFEKTVAGTLDRRRFSTLLLTLFAALAIVLAVVGIYGLLGYWVSIRERDIAIRMALGARSTSILGWVGSQAVRLAVIGVAFGIAGALLASYWMRSLVFGISPRSPAIMLSASAAVILLTILATAAPAWRAAHVDPLRKLHEA